MANVLKFVFYFVLASVVWRMINRVFFQRPQNGSKNAGREGVKVTKKADEKTYVPDDEGDYIDFEEVK